MTMELRRNKLTSVSTEGQLLLDAALFCVTLEPPIKPAAAPKPRAIPAGTYEIEWRFSPKRKVWLAGLIDVPGFSDIEIHNGNSAKDTEGCILVGEEALADFITNSLSTFKKLCPIVQQACENGKVYLTVYDYEPPQETAA